MDDTKRTRRQNGRNANEGLRLLNAKQGLDTLLPSFDGFPELREMAMQLRERTLKSLVEMEMKLPESNR